MKTLHVQYLFIVGMPHRRNKIQHVIFCPSGKTLILVETSYNHTHWIHIQTSLLTAKLCHVIIQDGVVYFYLFTNFSFFLLTVSIIAFIIISKSVKLLTLLTFRKILLILRHSDNTHMFIGAQLTNAMQSGSSRNPVESSAVNNSLISIQENG